MVAVPVVESPLGAPHGVRQLRLCQITGIWIEIGRADRVDNTLFESGRGNPVEKTLFENRVQSKPPRWLAPPGLATRSNDARRPRATEKAIGLFSQEGQTFLAQGRQGRACWMMRSPQAHGSAPNNCPYLCVFQIYLFVMALHRKRTLRLPKNAPYQVAARCARAICRKINSS